MLDDRPAPTTTTVIDATRIDAVVFDIGGVFTIRHHDAVRAGLSRAGFALPDGAEPYHRAHHVAVRTVTDMINGTAVMREHDRRLWAHWERGYLRSLGVPQHLMDDAVAAMIAVVNGTEIKNVWCQVLQENVDGFRRIVASGMPVAVVSNNDGTAEEQLLHLGICQVGPGPLPSVTAVVDSKLVGVAKPDPAIFEPALTALGTAPFRTLYVGDTVHADVLGATAAGMPVVQLDPYDLHAEFDHARLPDVGALADLLLAVR